MAHANRSRFPRVSVRRKSAWNQGPGSVTVQTQLTGTSAVMVGQGSAVALDGITQVRLRGLLSMHLPSASAALDGYAGAFGIAIVTLAAFNVGVTAVPSPITELAWDGWLYHTFFDLRAPGLIDGTAAVDVDNMLSTTAALRIEVDSKAMRKTKIDMVTIAVLEATEVGTALLSWRFNSRVLDKLP